MKTIGVIGGLGPQATMAFEAMVHEVSQNLIPPHFLTWVILLWSFTTTAIHPLSWTSGAFQSHPGGLNPIWSLHWAIWGGNG